MFSAEEDTAASEIELLAYSAGFGACRAGPLHTAIVTMVTCEVGPGFWSVAYHSWWYFDKPMKHAVL